MSADQSGQSADTVEGLDNAATKAPAIPKIDKSEQKQADRLRLIKRFQSEDIFGDITARSSGMTVIAKPRFYSLGFEDKQSFVSVLYAYYFDGSKPYVTIALHDSRSNKKVGTFTQELGLELK
jgi:hypothetical protein